MSDTSYPTVKISGNIIINCEGYAIEFSPEAKNCEVKLVKRGEDLTKKIVKQVKSFKLKKL